MANLCVFCGSSGGTDPTFRAIATELGTVIAGEGHRLVYGGGHVGLMGAVADGVLDAGGEAVGVMTAHLVALEVQHDGLTELEVLPDMHRRKARMAELADGVIVLPGGFGTYEEAFEALTWNQLGLISSPVVFLDVVVDGDAFYRPLFEFIAGAVAAGFVHDRHGALAQRATTVVDAVTRAAGPAPDYVRKWVD